LAITLPLRRSINVSQTRNASGTVSMERSTVTGVSVPIRSSGLCASASRVNGLTDHRALRLLAIDSSCSPIFTVLTVWALAVGVDQRVDDEHARFACPRSAACRTGRLAGTGDRLLELDRRRRNEIDRRRRSRRGGGRGCRRRGGCRRWSSGRGRGDWRGCRLRGRGRTGRTRASGQRDEGDDAQAPDRVMQVVSHFLDPSVRTSRALLIVWGRPGPALV
jgi:hypothetical protein